MIRFRSLQVATRSLASILLMASVLAGPRAVSGQELDESEFEPVACLGLFDADGRRVGGPLLTGDNFTFAMGVTDSVVLTRFTPAGQGGDGWLIVLQPRRLEGGPFQEEFEGVPYAAVATRDEGTFYTASDCAGGAYHLVNAEGSGFAGGVATANVFPVEQRGDGALLFELVLADADGAPEPTDIDILSWRGPDGECANVDPASELVLEAGTAVPAEDYGRLPFVGPFSLREVPCPSSPPGRGRGGNG